MKKYTPHIIAFVLMLCPMVSFAEDFAGGFVPLAKTETGSKLGNLYGSNGLGDYMNNMFIFALSMGAIFAVIKIMWAGYLYMSSDSFGNMNRAKEILSNVTIGLLLLMGTWLVLNQINPQILDLSAFKTAVGGD